MSDGEAAAIVKAEQTLQIPSVADIQNGRRVSFRRPLGVAEVLVVASTAPIQKALKPLQTLVWEQRSPARSESQVAQRAEVAIVSLLDDLAVGTRSDAKSTLDVRTLDTQQMAALSIAFEIADEA